MKKYRLVIEHLPSGKVFYSDSGEYELKNDDFITLENLVKKAATGELSYMEIQYCGNRQYFSREVLAESVITIEVINVN